MEDTPKARRGRRRLDEGPALDRERLVAALMTLTRSEGVDALNMRRVAKELGVSTRLIYHHVRDKADMIDLLADEITGTAMPDLKNGDWEQRLRNVVQAARHTYGAFPGIPAAILSRSLQPLERPNARYIRAGVMTALREAGLDQRQAQIAFIQFATITMGSMIVHESLTRVGAPSEIEPQRVEEGIDLAIDLLLFGIKRLANQGSNG